MPTNGLILSVCLSDVNILVNFCVLVLKFALQSGLTIFSGFLLGPSNRKVSNSHLSVCLSIYLCLFVLKKKMVKSIFVYQGVLHSPNFEADDKFWLCPLPTF